MSADLDNLPADLLNPSNFARLPSTDAPVLMVVIDTEEEFDWRKPASRIETRVSAMEHVFKAQRRFDERGVRPCYVMDYAVASQAQGYAPLKEIHDSGRCVVGAHLHPWVNPPHDEPHRPEYTFPGNLEPDLERRKLEILRSEIELSFGPVEIYKAGRYGLGAATARILKSLGFGIDLSPSPGFDYSSEGGPNYHDFPTDPFWADDARSLLCLPCTGGLVGVAGAWRHGLYRFATQRCPPGLRVAGILARSGMVERIRLSPEGYTLRELKRLTRYLMAGGVRVLTLSFHSPTLKAGCTPYTTNEAEVGRLVDRVAAYLDYFVERTGGQVLNPVEVRALLQARAEVRAYPSRF